MKIHFILVEPAVPENVGAAARAIKTMGFDSLWLVNTRAHLDPKAGYLAHASGEILDNARVFDDFEQMLEQLDLSIATSAKKRSVKYEYHQAEEIPVLLEAKKGQLQHVGVIFGREEYGLKNEELKHCDLVSRLSMSTTYPSLNLGQAVMIYAYILSSADAPQKMEEKSYSGDEWHALKNKVTQILPLIDLPESTNIHGRIMERLTHITRDDSHLLHSICNEILKKLGKKS